MTRSGSRRTPMPRRLAGPNRTSVLARLTGVEPGHAHSGFRQILIDGAGEWRSAAQESA
jgi:hypothetical protein